MVQHTEWTVEDREPTWFARLLTPPGARRPAGAAALVAAAGAAAYVASLVLDWQRITVTARPEADASTRTFTANLATVDTLSLAYVLGGIAVLSLAGAVLGRPELAVRLRMAAMGLGAGLGGVVLAITLRLRHAVFGVSGLLSAIYGQVDTEPRNAVALSYQPGVICGFAAVVLPVVALWMTAHVATRAPAAAPPAAGDSASDGRGADHMGLGVQVPAGALDWRGTGGIGRGRLTVSASEPLDLTVTPGETWST